MIITTINNNKLFIQLDSLVSNGKISVLDDKGHREMITLKNSNFEEMDLPLGLKKILITIEIGNEIITKTIDLL